jgi:hypothetical protein
LHAIIHALGAIGDRSALPELRAFLVMYRTDPHFAEGGSPLDAVVDALLVLGGPSEHELLAWVAAEPRTLGPVAEHARRVLEAPAPATPGKDAAQSR